MALKRGRSLSRSNMGEHLRAVKVMDTKSGPSQETWLSAFSWVRREVRSYRLQISHLVSHHMTELANQAAISPCCRNPFVLSTCPTPSLLSGTLNCVPSDAKCRPALIKSHPEMHHAGRNCLRDRQALPSYSQDVRLFPSARPDLPVHLPLINRGVVIVTGAGVAGISPRATVGSAYPHSRY